MDEPDSQPPEASSAGKVVRRIQGQLHSVQPVSDDSGKVVQQLVSPLMVEVRFRDLCQILIGACVLAIPVAFTEEVWTLGRELPMLNVLGIGLTSVVFLSLFAEL